MFYKKHLHSIEELQAERLALKKEAKKKAKEMAKAEKEPKDNHFLDKGIDFLTGSLAGNSKLGPVIDIAAKLAVPVLLRKGAQLGTKKILLTVAKEIGFGYVKWKAISMAVKIVSNKIKKKKEA